MSSKKSRNCRLTAFYRVFPPTVHRGPKQSPTLTWIYNRCADGRGVVTPRDVIELLIRAKQKQQDDCISSPAGASDWIVGPTALQYGLREMSKDKCVSFLQAEFPHLWKHIEKFVGGKTEYDSAAMRRALGRNWEKHVADLVSIGLFAKKKRRQHVVYWVPFLYRHGLDLTQGRAGKARST